MRRFLLSHLLLVGVVAASLWLLAGFVLIDQRWEYPYDDGSWGTMYFFGQAVAHLILLRDSALQTRWLTRSSRWEGGS